MRRSTSTLPILRKGGQSGWSVNSKRPSSRLSSRPGITVVAWESVLVRNHLYAHPFLNERIVPVLFDPRDRQFVPASLAAITSYTLNPPSFSGDDYVKLYRHLTGQPETPRPRLGSPLTLPPLPRPGVSGPRGDALKAPQPEAAAGVGEVTKAEADLSHRSTGGLGDIPTQLVLTLDGKVADFSEKKKASFQRALGEILESDGSVRIVQVADKGGISITLEKDAQSLAMLMMQALRGEIAGYRVLAVDYGGAHREIAAPRGTAAANGAVPGATGGRGLGRGVRPWIALVIVLFLLGAGLLKFWPWNGRPKPFTTKLNVFVDDARPSSLEPSSLYMTAPYFARVGTYDIGGDKFPNGRRIDLPEKGGKYTLDYIVIPAGGPTGPGRPTNLVVRDNANLVVPNTRYIKAFPVERDEETIVLTKDDIVFPKPDGRMP